MKRKIEEGLEKFDGLSQKTDLEPFLKPLNYLYRSFAYLTLKKFD